MSRKKNNNRKKKSVSLVDSDFSALDQFVDGPHIPVLLEECLEALNLRPGLTYVDATLGAGGHYFAIKEKLKGTSKVIGFDRDESCVAEIKNKSDQPDLIFHANNCQIKNFVTTVDGGILADLGVSSMQLDNPERGFSFQTDAPLDMRMDNSQTLTAEQLINSLSEAELSDIIFKYGEERHSRKIAHAIIGNRPISSTKELADLVSRTLNRFQKSRTKSNMTSGARKRREKHPATRTFQAIRIAVNEELASLEKFLDEAVQILEPGSRLAIISFHSLEDRIVKQFLKLKEAECICPRGYPVCKCSKERELRIITRKPIVASEAELAVNVRARSAKLRVAEKV